MNRRAFILMVGGSAAWIFSPNIPIEESYEQLRGFSVTNKFPLEIFTTGGGMEFVRMYDGDCALLETKDRAMDGLFCVLTATGWRALASKERGIELLRSNLVGMDFIPEKREWVMSELTKVWNLV